MAGGRRTDEMTAKANGKGNFANGLFAAAAAASIRRKVRENALLRGKKFGLNPDHFEERESHYVGIVLKVPGLNERLSQLGHHL